MYRVTKQLHTGELSAIKPMAPFSDRQEAQTAADGLNRAHRCSRDYMTFIVVEERARPVVMRADYRQLALIEVTV